MCAKEFWFRGNTLYFYGTNQTTAEEQIVSRVWLMHSDTRCNMVKPGTLIRQKLCKLTAIAVSGSQQAGLKSIDKYMLKEFCGRHPLPHHQLFENV
jgi:hypothetical protein